MDSNTNLFALIGHPIEHSLSPEFQNKLIELYDLNSVYLAFDVLPDNLKYIKETIKSLNIKGLNVTVPYKERIIPYLDDIDEGAEKIGAVNTIIYENNRLKGFNTDIIGFQKMIESLNINIHEYNVVVIGSGGASKAIIKAFENLHVENIHIFNRTIKNSEELLKKFEFKSKKISMLNEFSIGDDMLIINTTSIGLKSNESPVEINKRVKNSILIDIIYNPIETKLIRDAKENGIYTLNGLPMLIYQGQASFSIWNRIDDPYKYHELLRQILLEKLV
ncbi:MAG: shikimate dehydrogenase [Clostridiales bacterium]|nr:shikimate dehydrogenase [Clostridiales bacterium]